MTSSSLATRKGVLVLGLPLIAATTPAPTWWAHDSGCAWAVAWLTLRGRMYLGPRELLDDPHWSGKLDWLDRHGFKRSGHRPDLVGFVNGHAIAVEVELATKSKPRLDAILNLHLGWIIARRTSSVVYICGDGEGCHRIERAGRRVGLYFMLGDNRAQSDDSRFWGPVRKSWIVGKVIAH